MLCWIRDFVLSAFASSKKVIDAVDANKDLSSANQILKSHIHQQNSKLKELEANILIELNNKDTQLKRTEQLLSEKETERARLSADHILLKSKRQQLETQLQEAIIKENSQRNKILETERQLVDAVKQRDRYNEIGQITLKRLENIKTISTKLKHQSKFPQVANCISRAAVEENYQVAEEELDTIVDLDTLNHRLYKAQTPSTPVLTTIQTIANSKAEQVEEPIDYSKLALA
jgi:chromosome segregation ATPase